MTAGTVTPPGTGSGAEPGTGTGSLGVRLGVLFGPAVFGVTAAGVALPDVARALDASPSATAWVLTAHALALGVGTALAGRFSDAVGVRRTLLLGALVLAAGAALCLAAPNLGTLVAGRFVLAAGSGAMVSVALALVAGVAPERRARVLAVFGATMAAFSAAATLAGGVVTEYLSWRLTLVLPALSLFAVPFTLPLTARRPGSGRSVDLIGAGLLTLTAGSFLVLVQTQSLDLSAPVVVATAGVLVLAGAGCAVRVVRRPEGFVPRRLVTDRLFLRAAAVGAGVYAGLFGIMYAVPQLLVSEHDWGVLEVGAWLLPGAVAGAALSRAAGRLGPRARTLLAATAATAAALLAAAALTDSAVLLVTGTSGALAAFAVTQVTLTGLLSGRMPPERRGGALSLLNLTFFIGGGAGSALAGAVASSSGLVAAVGATAVLPLAAGALALRLPKA